MAFAGNWVEDHDVDPAPLDRLPNSENFTVDLYTYTFIQDAICETWDASGVALPWWSTHVYCAEASALADEHEDSGCQCGDDDFGPTCKLAGRWPGRPTDAHRRYTQWQRKQLEDKYERIRNEKLDADNATLGQADQP